MKRFVVLVAAVVIALGGLSTAYANYCAFDPVPAATLLFPFVTFDYNNPIDGANTLFSITNVSSQAQIVHVTVWNDLSVAFLDFNVILSGYDVQTMSIRDILYYGILPDTGTTTKTVYEDGPVPEDDGPVAPAFGLPDAQSTTALVDRCDPDDTAYPVYDPIPQSYLDLFRYSYVEQSQTYNLGHVSFCSTPPSAYQIGDWFETRGTDDPSWVYITADVVQNCNLFFPDVDAAYWANEVRYDNVLIGDVFWVNDSARFSEATEAVHIEAIGVYGGTSPFPIPTVGDITFYERYANNVDLGTSYEDGREPLPTAWAMRYMGAGTDEIDTYIRAWKGSTFYTTVYDYWWIDIFDDGDEWLFADDCYAYTYYAWDEEEDVVGVDENPWSAPGVSVLRPNLLPLETQEVSIDQFNTPDSSGWILFVWPPSNAPHGGGIGYSELLDIYQTWMGVRYAAYGNYSAAMNGIVMANWLCFPAQDLPNLNIDYVNLYGPFLPALEAAQ